MNPYLPLYVCMYVCVCVLLAALPAYEAYCECNTQYKGCSGHIKRFRALAARIIEKKTEREREVASRTSSQSGIIEGIIQLVLTEDSRICRRISSTSSTGE